ncbi:MAG: ComF family protein [Patescibacteria group bacterium]|nr:ComF family protein [Patescibacteria group bacterium]
MNNKLKRFFLDLLFPRACFGCKKEQTYLCQDCESVLEVFYTHQKFKNPQLDDLYFAVSYEKPLIKRLITQFKCQPFVKELSQNLSQLIINHFQLIEFNNHEFNNFLIVPVPLYIKRLKWRGFNQAEELAKYLSEFFKIPLINDVLIKNKQTKLQVELPKEKGKQNIINAFKCINKEKIQNRNILLVDDIYITGSTVTECARILKNSGAKKIIGAVIAIAQP